MLQSRRKHEFVLASFFIEQKKEELVRKHGMKMTVGLERRLETMCNLSENLIEKGEERGREAGLREGKAIGIIESGVEFGGSKSQILEKLQGKLNISLEMAQEYFEKYACEVKE